MRIGIDLGGTKIEGIVIEDDGIVMHKYRTTTPKDDYKGSIDSIKDLVLRLEKVAGCTMKVGIGTPGSLSGRTGLMKNCNSTWLNHQPFKQDIELALGREIRMENDANCFALSEAVYGSGKTATSVFGVILGTGTGGGLVVNRQLINGPNRITGEWGHIQVPHFNETLFPGERLCYCGKSNCVETFLSGKGLEQTFFELGGMACSAAQIASRAATGEELSVRTLSVYCDQLSACLSIIINTLDPDLIVFGGGLSKIDTIYHQVPRTIPNYVFSDTVETRFMRPEFGDASGARGAACLWPLD